MDDILIRHKDKIKHEDEINSVLTLKYNYTSELMFLSIEFLFKIISELQCHANLKILNLSVCSNIDITKEFAEQLAVVLANSTKLETLLLEGCLLGNEGLNLIANSLKNITTLKHLDLSNNEITKDSVIISILEVNSGIEMLHLHKNCLHSTAGDRLYVAIVKLKKLKELSIDKYIISRNMALKLANSFSPTIERNLFIYDHSNQTMESMDIKCPLSCINTLTMSKDLIMESNLSTGFRVMTFNSILETGIVSLRWVQSNIICTTEVLRFLSSLKQITTIELCNISGSGLTELEVDRIATVISENEQLENVWLSSYFVKVYSMILIHLEQWKTKYPLRN